MARLLNALLLLAVVVLGGYVALSTFAARPGGDSEWEQATDRYLRAYYAWLAEDPVSGWARLEPLAADAERERLAALRPRVAVDGRRTDLAIEGQPEYRVLWKSGSQALVVAHYRLHANGETREVAETYLLGRNQPGIGTTPSDWSASPIVVRQVVPAA